MRNLFMAAATTLIAGASVALAQSSSPNGVKTLAPEGAIKATGTWDVGTRARDFIFVAGMRGIDPKSAGRRGAHPPGVPEHEADRRIRRRAPARLRSHRRPCDRHV